MRNAGWNFFSGRVVERSRQLSTLLNGLIDAGFRLEHVDEPEATAEALERRPDLAEECRRSPFLLVKAGKH